MDCAPLVRLAGDYLILERELDPTARLTHAWHELPITRSCSSGADKFVGSEVAAVSFYTTSPPGTSDPGFDDRVLEMATGGKAVPRPLRMDDAAQRHAPAADGRLRSNRRAIRSICSRESCPDFLSRFRRAPG